MPRIVIKVIRSRRRMDAWDFIEAETKKVMEDEVKPLLLDYHERMVRPWSAENRPRFKVRKVSTPYYLAIDVWPVKGSKGADIWRWVSKGTKKRTIVPKNKKALTFQLGYKPRTWRGGRYRGPGKATGKWVTVSKVENHEIKARHFEKTIARWAKKPFRRRMENAIRRGVRAYNRAIAAQTMIE